MSAFDDLERQLLNSVRRTADIASPQSTPRPGPRRSRAVWAAPRHTAGRMAAIVAVGVAVAVAVLFIGTTGRGPSSASAFAGWTTSPTSASAAQLRRAESACAHHAPLIESAKPAVSDTRGPGSLLVYSTRAATTTCVTGRPQLGTETLTRRATDVLTASDAVEPESLGLEFAADGQGFREIAGQVGSDVTSVVIVLQGGDHIQATVNNGWFAAWWPVSRVPQSGAGLSQALSDSIPQSFNIETSNGTEVAPLTTTEIQAATQAPYLDGVASPTNATGATGTTTQTPPPTGEALLAASFAVLRQPQPSPVALPPSISGAYTGPAQPPNPYGVNPNLAVYVAAARTWILPGTSGVCIQGPSAGCDSTQAALAGDFLFSTGDTYVGLAPDGNSTVTVTDANGTTSQVTVTGNVYVITGGEPTAITLRDSSGATTRLPLPAKNVAP